MRLAFLAFVAAASLPSLAEAKCQLTPFNFRFGTDASATWACDAKGGGVRFSPGAGLFESLTVAQGPARGKVTPNGKAAFTYRPAGGFTGADKFIIRICGTSAVSKGCSNITYSVTVS